MLALALQGKEPKELILSEWSTDGSPELLACIVRVRDCCAAGASRVLLVGVKTSVAEKTKDGTVIVVGTLFRDHVDGSPFGPSVDCRKSLRANHKFLDGLQGKLHDRAAYGVVLIIYPVDGNVDVPPARAIYRQNRVAVFSGIVRIGSLNPGREVGKIGNIAPDHRQFFDLFGSNLQADAGLCCIHDRSGVGHFNN